MDNLDQLSSLLSPILNDPEAMAGIAQAAQQLGLGELLGGTGESDESAAVSSADGKKPVEETCSDGDSVSSMLGSILPLLTGSGRQDDSSRLLCALRPFLHGDRAKRLDDAERMVKLLGVMNVMRRQGII